MTPRLSIFCFLLSAFCAVAQPVPPAQEWSIQSALVWQVPEPQPPVTNITFTLPAPVTVMASSDLISWHATSIKVTATFTVTNNGGNEFFKLEPGIKPVAEGTNKISWNPPVGAVGTRLYIGSESGMYLQCIDLGNVTSAVIIWPYRVSFYALTSYDAVGNESDFSEEGVDLSYERYEYDLGCIAAGGTFATRVWQCKELCCPRIQRGQLFC